MGAASDEGDEEEEEEEEVEEDDGEADDDEGLGLGEPETLLGAGWGAAADASESSDGYGSSDEADPDFVLRFCTNCTAPLDALVCMVCRALAETRPTLLSRNYFSQSAAWCLLVDMHVGSML